MTGNERRAPWLAPDELDAGQRALYDAIVGGDRGRDPAFALTDAHGRLEGPFDAMLLAPATGGAVQELGAALRYRTSLTGREREIAILAVAHAHDSAFEVYAHERVARRSGLSEAELADLRDGRAAGTFGAEEAQVHAVVTALVATRDLDDASFRAGEAALGRARLAELVTLVGYYEMLALSLRVWRVPLPDAD
ncbi:carboxymuconolactone decarboxylase family protein [Pimelobacter simplex]|uniref:Carboxymuconolactone decarboxylase family protein n=1 Tax=Nocardioides simplex TaxID=2045 RepID=A0A7J5DUI1_NOCSI|nr:carboxymuconolactone decarboxylase family protein [Pimelobacter simplex]KAB2808982.1 carboxymuconolactone decarboxylase family protein [Pimelobacter simplex]